MTVRAVLTPAARGARWLRWYLRELTGESGYDRYLAHARADHPQVPPASRREFERQRMDAWETNPRSRCC